MIQKPIKKADVQIPKEKFMQNLWCKIIKNKFTPTFRKISPTMLSAEILEEGVSVLPFNVTSPTEIKNM